MNATDTHRIDDADWEVIAERDDSGGDYEWGFAVLVRRPDGQLFLGLDSGCSCYGPWDGLRTESDFIAVPTWQDAIEHLKGDRPYLFTDDDVAKFAEALMELRPEPSPR